MREMGVKSSVLASSKIPQMKNTDQFMKEMGVMDTDMLNSDNKIKNLNQDLASIRTPNLNYDYGMGYNPSIEPTPLKTQQQV